MPTKEEILEKQTFKNEGVELDKRVFYTLNDNKDLQSHRNSKLLAILFKKLVENNSIIDSEIDDILLEVCH
jgi:hypothetical protein